MLNRITIFILVSAFASHTGAWQNHKARFGVCKITAIFSFYFNDLLIDYENYASFFYWTGVLGRPIHPKRRRG